MAMNSRLLRPTASGFNPKTLAGLVAWFDGTDSSTIDLDNNGGVSLWRDKSGLNRTAAQTIANNRPTLGTLAGKQAVAFDADDDFLNFNTAPNSGAETLFLVTSHFPGNKVIFGTFRLYNSVGGTFIENAYGGFTVGVNRTTVPFPAGQIRYLFTSRIGSTGNRSVLTTTNNSTGSQTPTTATATARVNLFGTIGSSAGLGGAIGEFLIYNRDLADAEFFAAESYLLKKWRV